MKNILILISAGLLLISTSCNKSSDVQPATDNSATSADRTATSGTTIGKQMLQHITVYYNTQRFNVTLQRYLSKSMLSPAAEHTMYVVRESVPEGAKSRFLPVIDALPSGEFSVNQLWRVAYISFGPGLAPYQPVSAEEILKLLSTGAAVAENTDIVYEMMMAPSLDQTSK
jgi:hypothetical protein